ncbi:hypothetical protein R1sor_016126 [Riccia sorocarpa]|uniref:Uncharacterized protein n=1 Tax=Riccia sorocarpa TaxID=122646 RepID=A0ABD3HHB2_9MARC
MWWVRIESKGLDDDDLVADGVESDQETKVDDELQEVPLQEGDDEPQVQLPTEYGLWACGKIMEFCSLFRVRCPRDGCMLYCLPPIVTELQQCWQVKFQCDDGHTTVFVTGEMERDKGSPHVTGQLYHAALCAGLSYTSVSSMLAAIRVHVPSEALLIDIYHLIPAMQSDAFHGKSSKSPSFQQQESFQRTLLGASWLLPRANNAYMSSNQI